MGWNCCVGLYRHENCCKNCWDFKDMNYLGPTSGEYFGSRGLGCIVLVGVGVKTGCCKAIAAGFFDRSFEVHLELTIALNMGCHLFD